MKFGDFARKASNVLGSPYAFAIALGMVILWAVSGPIFKFSEAWQLVINTGTTISTFLMVFVLQHSQNSDTKAIQQKLDELIHALPEAHNEVAGIERKEDA